MRFQVVGVGYVDTPPLGSGAVGDVQDFAQLRQSWLDYAQQLTQDANTLDTQREAAGIDSEKLLPVLQLANEMLQRSSATSETLRVRTEQTAPVYQSNWGKLVDLSSRTQDLARKATDTVRELLQQYETETDPQTKIDLYDAAVRAQAQAEDATAAASLVLQAMETYHATWVSVLDAADSTSIPARDLMLAASRTAAALGQAGLSESADALEKHAADLEKIWAQTEALINKLQRQADPDSFTETLKKVSWVVGGAAAVALGVTAIAALIRR